MRKNISSNSPWEEVVGYSRAVRIGNTIEVSGTTAMNGDVLVGKDDLYAQTKFIIQKMEVALKEAGATLDDVIRTRMYVTDINLWNEAARAHAEFFGSIKPASTMVEVAKLIHQDMLIEMEATAVVQ